MCLTLLMPRKISTTKSEQAIKDMMPFHTYGAMYAEKYIRFIGNADVDDTRYQITYTVYSYSEPIAEIQAEVDEYHNILKFVKSMNPRKYSRTTSKHQGYARRALDSMQ